MIVQGLNFAGENADAMVTKGLELITALATAIIENVPVLLEAAVNCAVAFGNALISYDWASLGSQLLSSIQGLFPEGSATEIMQPILDGITAALPGLLNTGIEIITNLANGILAAAPQLLTTAAELIVQFADFVLTNLPTIIDAGVQLVVNLGTGILQALPQLISVAQNLMMKLGATLIAHLPEILAVGVTVPLKVAAGIAQSLPQLMASAIKMCTTIAENITKYDWIGLGKNVIDGIIKGVQSAGDALITAILSMCQGALGAVKKFFGIASPSKVMADQVGKYIPEGIALGIEENASVVDDAIHDMVMDAATSEALTDVSFAAPGFQTGNNTGALLARMDAMLSLMEKYYPEMAESGGEISISAINRQLGVAYS